MLGEKDAAAISQCDETPQLLTLRRILLPSISLCLDLVSGFLLLFYLFSTPFKMNCCRFKICDIALKHLDEKCHWVAGRLFVPKFCTNGTRKGDDKEDQQKFTLHAATVAIEDFAINKIVFAQKQLFYFPV